MTILSFAQRALLWTALGACLTCGSLQATAPPVDPEGQFVTVAILAKDKGPMLPLYLACLEQQTWPASHTYLYIRTNNNRDDSAQILRDWIERVGHRYAGVYFEDRDLEFPLEEFEPHEWNYLRVKVLAHLRKQSLKWAAAHHSHYFVADCDNFIRPEVIATLMATRLPVVSPMLHCSGNDPRVSPYYSNYHQAVTPEGYWDQTPHYWTVWERGITGLIEEPVVHCTYLIRHEVLPLVSYDDGSGRYEYVIFSDSCRKQGIQQYLDNRSVYGFITFAETTEALAAEPWLPQVYDWLQGLAVMPERLSPPPEPVLTSSESSPPATDAAS